MITRNFEITIRIPEQNYIPTLFQVVENDKDVYNLTIHITDGINEIDYSQVSSATITFALANGAVVQSDPERLTVSATGIIYQMGTSEIACPGKVLASIQLFGEEGERLTTARFRFEVVADLITPGAVQSESRFPILQQLVADVEQLKQDIVDLQIPDGSIMDVKLSDAAGQIKQRFASHVADYASAHGGIYRKNLLHNWDFRRPVNQRDQSSYGTSLSYTIDRWCMGYLLSPNEMTVSVGNWYITLNNTGSAVRELQQKIDNISLLLNKTVTLSVMLPDGQILSKSDVVSMPMDRTAGRVYIYDNDGVTILGFVQLYSENADTPPYIRICTYGGQTLKLAAIKLELGSVSTLANDPPADYGEQLMLCKRFFRLWTTEAARTEALKEVGLMRIPNPTLGTINIGGTTYYYASADL